MILKRLLNSKELPCILRNWNISNYRLVELIETYGGNVLLITLNNGKKLVLKDKIDSEKAKRDTILLSELDRYGIPVSAPLLTTNNECGVQYENHYYWLYPYIHGRIFKRHYSHGYLKRAEIFGEAVGKLHLAFREVSVGNLFPNVCIYDQICTSITNKLRKYSQYFNIYVLNQALDNIKNDFCLLHSQLPIQLIHRDIHPSNMIYCNGRIVGYLDFEIVQKSVRIYDICYCATSILVGGFKNIENREKWLSILKALLKGYSKYVSVTEAERKSIYFVLLCIQLHFMSYCVDKNLRSSLCNEKLLHWIMENKDVIETHVCCL